MQEGDFGEGPPRSGDAAAGRAPAPASGGLVATAGAGLWWGQAARPPRAPTPLPSQFGPCCPHGSICPGSAQTPLALLLLLARGCAAAARPPRPLPGPAFEAGLLAEVGIALMAFLPPSSSTNAFSPPLRSPSPIPLFPAAKSIAAGGGWEGRDKNKREF